MLLGQLLCQRTLYGLQLGSGEPVNPAAHLVNGVTSMVVGSLEGRREVGFVKDRLVLLRLDCFSRCVTSGTALW